MLNFLTKVIGGNQVTLKDLDSTLILLVDEVDEETKLHLSSL